MASESPSKWKVPDAAALIWECWGDEYVLFHANSGKTHFLNASGALILRLLSRQPYDVAELTVELGRHDARQVDDALIAQVRHLIGEFERLGLVSRVTHARSVPC